jgi:DNA polymerase-3 subunit delta
MSKPERAGPPPARAADPALVLVCGAEDLTVKERAQALYRQWCAAVGGLDHELLNGTAGNAEEALQALSRLREALQTLPMFGRAKVVWFQDCNFLGTDQTSTAASVGKALEGLAQDFERLTWGDLRLVISAGEVDKRRLFVKTVGRLGAVEEIAGLSYENKDWESQAQACVADALRARNKTISGEACAQAAALVGPHIRVLRNEAEKLALYVGERAEVRLEDVAAVVTGEKHAKDFALADAVGARRLPEVLQALDDALWEMRSDKKKSAIGLLYQLISKVRGLLLVKDLVRGGHLKPGGHPGALRAQLNRMPPLALPADKRYNPLAMNPYALFNTLKQSVNYTTAELVRAMRVLLDCNRRLVSSQVEDGLILQQALVAIVGAGAPLPPPSGTGQQPSAGQR